MPRPPLPVGTWGRIRREAIAPGGHRARARFRDYDGITRDVEAWGTTGAAAERALLVLLRDRSTPNFDEITRETRLTQLAELWLEDINAEGHLAPQTINNYEDCVHGTILPALGNLRLREVSVGRMDRFFKTIKAKHPAKARIARVVLGQMLGMAVRHDALPSNPIRDVARIRRRRRQVRALSIEDLGTVRAAIWCWQTTPAGKPGPRRTDNLADIMDILLATGGRIGEILALRWPDVDLSAQPVALTFSGTLARVKNKGLHRQPWPKTHHSYRTVILPAFAVDVLLRRHVDTTNTPTKAVFPSRRGTWLSPHNVRRQWREARHETGLEWVTPHTFRKTVATLLDREADTKTAAAQLGHANEEITTAHYVEKAHVAPDSSGILNTLGTGGHATDPTQASS